jgi:hypothetical protein
MREDGGGEGEGDGASSVPLPLIAILIAPLRAHPRFHVYITHKSFIAARRRGSTYAAARE